MDGDVTFQKLDHGAADLVLAVHHNLYGNRMVTASSDQHLRVWDKKGQEWALTDAWRAHDGEILDVQWAPPTTGSLLASISTDTTLRIFLESPTNAPLSGHRFLHIHTIPSKSPLPYQSLHFKPHHPSPLLAAITHVGNLSVLEPSDPADPTSEWQEWFQGNDYHVLDPPPPTSDETSFKVHWHMERLPCWTAVAAGLPRTSLGLAVAAMDVVKIYRTDRERKFYVAAELTGARDLVRGVAWSNGSMRGFDVIATASKDGSVRVYEVRTPPGVQQKQAGDLSASDEEKREDTPAQQRLRTARSGIGAGLAEMSRGTAGAGSPEEPQDPSRVKQEATCVAVLAGHKGAVWRVNFSMTGDLLMSTGDDGTVRTWKRDLDGSWAEFAEIDVEALQEADEQDEDE